MEKMEIDFSPQSADFVWGGRKHRCLTYQRTGLVKRTAAMTDLILPIVKLDTGAAISVLFSDDAGLDAKAINRKVFPQSLLRLKAGGRYIEGEPHYIGLRFDEEDDYMTIPVLMPTSLSVTEKLPFRLILGSFGFMEFFDLFLYSGSTGSSRIKETEERFFTRKLSHEESSG